MDTKVTQTGSSFLWEDPGHVERVESSRLCRGDELMLKSERLQIDRLVQGASVLHVGCTDGTTLEVPRGARLWVVRHP